MSRKKSDEKTLYVDEEIGVGRWKVDYGRFSIVVYLMYGEECNQRRMTKKTEESYSGFAL